MAKVAFAMYGDYGGRPVGCTYGNDVLTYTEDADGMEATYEDRDTPVWAIEAQLAAWAAPEALIDSITHELERQERITA